MLAKSPEWWGWIDAAQELNCSVFDLLARPDMGFWLACALARKEMIAKVEDEEANKNS